MAPSPQPDPKAPVTGQAEQEGKADPAKRSSSIDSRATDVKYESSAKQGTKKMDFVNDDLIKLGFSASFSSSLK